jgi:16S rRNA (cytosine967-C5)-methyltransferase
MKHFFTRLRQLQEILDTYSYPFPFANHLKQYLQKHKQLGGKDRKELKALCYGYFRLSRAMEGESVETIARHAACFMGYQTDDEALNALCETLKDKSTDEKIDIFAKEVKSFDESFIFPFSELASEAFQNQDFQNSFLEQPKVWIKIAGQKYNEVISELKKQDIQYTEISKGVLGFAADTRISELISFKEGYFRIQDLSSQQTSEAFNPQPGESWWDCCAGAGGKTMALLEKQPEIKLYASDIRESVLTNLDKRVSQLYRILHPDLKRKYLEYIHIFASDVTEPIKEIKLPDFDGIIIDAPCTGSGTWSRNPENLLYFDPKVISDYQQRQLAILENVFPYLKPGKPLIYITCSVFRAENEEVIKRFTGNHSVSIEEQKYIEGYRQSAENMFLCRMIKKD